MSKPATAAKDWSDVVKGAKRELLLRAARDEFAEQGLEGATMRGIALRAGCTTGAIYPLFDSKEAIYAELLRPWLPRGRRKRRLRRPAAPS
jgi:AcrR family transcriptional regulator